MKVYYYRNRLSNGNERIITEFSRAPLKRMTGLGSFFLQNSL